MISLSRVSARLTRINALLDEERNVMRRGNIQKLETMIAERERHVEDLRGTIDPSDQQSVQRLKQIQEKAARNAELLNAALNGLRAGAARIAEIDEAREKLSTYSESGKVKDVASKPGRIEKRA